MDALGEGDFLSLPQGRTDTLLVQTQSLSYLSLLADFLGNPYISAGVLIDTDLALQARLFIVDVHGDRSINIDANVS